jgi:outer membrane autotransporter protein
LTGNAGYRFDVLEKWFIEPSVGGVFSHASVNPLNVGGLLLVSSGTVERFSLPGTIQIDDFDSELGRASMRVGTTIATPDGTAIAQPFFSASVYHEFAGAVKTSLSGAWPQSAPGTPPFSLAQAR